MSQKLTSAVVGARKRRLFTHWIGAGRRLLFGKQTHTDSETDPLLSTYDAHETTIQQTEATVNEGQKATTARDDYCRQRKRLKAFVPAIRGQLEADGAVIVWRLPAHISQSRFGDRPFISNACTIIALRMAEAMHSQGLTFTVPARVHTKMPQLSQGNTIDVVAGSDGGWPGGPIGESPLTTRNSAGLSSSFGSSDVTASSSLRRLGFWCAVSPAQKIDVPPPTMTLTVSVDLCLLNAFINSIVDGNALHESAMRHRRYNQQNFTIPDAIRASGEFICEIDFTTVRGQIWRNVTKCIRQAITYWDGLTDGANGLHMFLLVIAFERSVLLVYQPYDQNISIIDSHSHGQNSGALMATARIANLPSFCRWFTGEVFPESHYASNAQQEFEISIIQHRPQSVDAKCPASPKVAGQYPVVAADCVPMPTKGAVFGDKRPYSVDGGVRRLPSSVAGSSVTSSAYNFLVRPARLQQIDVALTVQCQKYARYSHSPSSSCKGSQE